MRTVSLYIATSLDGYIAKPDDDLSFLKLVEKEGEDYGYAEFTANIDTIILGRKLMTGCLGKLALLITITGTETFMLSQETKGQALVKPHSTRGI